MVEVTQFIGLYIHGELKTLNNCCMNLTTDAKKLVENISMFCKGDNEKGVQNNCEHDDEDCKVVKAISLMFIRRH